MLFSSSISRQYLSRIGSTRAFFMEIFGITGASEPPFQLKSQTQGYSIRSYERFFVAEVNRTSDDDGFRKLANYIGAFGSPQNSRSESMAMTAPVLADPPSSELRNQAIGENMKFVLPMNFQSMEEIPCPLDETITLKECSTQTVAVKGFSGWASQTLFQFKFHELLEELRKDQVIPLNVPEQDIKWCSAQYHPPFTLPFLRKNEIWIYLEK